MVLTNLAAPYLASEGRGYPASAWDPEVVARARLKDGFSHPASHEPAGKPPGWELRLHPRRLNPAP
jgi:hypothetical protein